MAGRAIAGIALGMLFLPVILLVPILWTWLTGITDFNNFLLTYLSAGVTSLYMPIIAVFGPLLTIETFLMMAAFSILAWVIIGMWSGAVERSAGRGIGVAVGIWLGWIIIEILIMVIDPTILGPISGFLDLLIAEWLPLVIGIIFAAIFGAITKSEEF